MTLVGGWVIANELLKIRKATKFQSLYSAKASMQVKYQL